MEESYSHIVVGAGALGTATAYRLARGGARRVLVIEQFALGHGFGASEDHSRIIRHTYHAAKYATLTQAAYDAWAEVEEESGVRLVHKTGGLDLAVSGTEAAEVELRNYRAAMDVSGVGYEVLDAVEIRKRWPQWRIGDDVEGLYQADGGILDIRKANAVHIALARALGVEFLPETAVTDLISTDSHVTVVTDRGRFTAESVVLAVASWTPNLLPRLGIHWPISLSQEQVCYFVPSVLRDFAMERFPVWIWHAEQVWYGFPMYGETAIKVARDLSGRFVTWDTRSYVPDPAETARVAEFIAELMPTGAGPELLSKTCVYDMPPDRDFVLDVLPGHPRIAIGIGSGHAGKFAALIGQILADLATTGSTPYPIDAFRADRPALTDPGFEPAFRLVG
ncbi:monomeric sarcosine oxidase [Catenulispora sp. EB89]|uniref:N-methyl-L-tryptophan oxidase n=1 Tax=Catenulispora sp. EB89 TaxID=3156257 RepID=UPI0035198EE0